MRDHHLPRAALLTFLVFCLVALGAVLRLVYFDRIEFGIDGVTAILTTRFWLSHGIPLYGQMSGASVMMPPGFIFLLYPLIRMTEAPLPVGLYIATFNIAAIWLIYRLGVEIGRPRAGFWAGAFMAVHPWLIIYSRMIWPQCMLPFFVILLLIVIAHCTHRPRSRLIFWCGPLISLIWQIHYSAYCVLVFFLIWFAVSVLKRRIRWPWTLGGFAAGFLIFFPHFYFLIHSNFRSIRQAFEGGVGEPTSLLRNIVALFKMFGETSFGGGLGFFFQRSQFRTISLARTPVGAAHPWLAPLALGGTLAFLLLFVTGFFARRRSRPSFSPWLGLLAVLPLLLYPFRGIRVPPWYFLAGLPAVVMLAGLGMDRISGIVERRLKGAARGYLPVLLGGFICLSGGITWLTFLDHIKENGGTGGMYGLTYRIQRRAAARLVEERIRLDRIDIRLTRARGFGILYLYDYLNNRRPPEIGYSENQARLINTYLFPDETCRIGAAERSTALPPPDPLRICISPVK